VLLVAIVLARGPAFAPTTGKKTGGGSPSTETLSTRPATALILEAADLGAGWADGVTRPLNATNQSGFVDGAFRLIEASSGRAAQDQESFKTAAWRFNSSPNASAFFDSQIPGGGGGDCGAGDRSDAWSYQAGVDDCFIQKGNVVWEATHYYQGGSTVLLGDVASDLVSKY
jgi:hypothetical protein